MTNKSAEIKRLKALLAKKDEKEKAATAEIKKTKVSNKAKTESNKKWKDKYMELKKESKAKDAELKKKRRLSQGTNSVRYAVSDSGDMRSLVFQVFLRLQS